MISFFDKFRGAPLFITSLLLLQSSDFVAAGDTHTRLEREIRRFIDSSKVSVVTITSKFSREVESEQESGILSFFKSERKRHPLTYVNVGTGIIVDHIGHVLARSSVVLGADSHLVTLAAGEEAPAEFIGYDPETGFSVLKLLVDEQFTPANLTTSTQIAAGAGTVMIGNSLGVFPSIFLGTVNGVMPDGMIQVSINLNPGSNGSPIYNYKGAVIGLVIGRLNVEPTRLSSFADVHYNEPTLAYPAKRIAKIAYDIIHHGQVRKGWLGVVGYHDGRKPKVREIKENSPAEHAGLSKGDIIVNYANRDIKSIAELVRLVEWTSPGERVTIEFLRGKELIRTEVEIGQRTPAPVQPEVQSRFTSVTRPVKTESAELNMRSMIERNRVLEMRINYLEQEIGRLRELLESK